MADSSKSAAAVTYLNKLRTLLDSPSYELFLSILTCFRSGEIEAAGVIRRVGRLLKQQQQQQSHASSSANDTVILKGLEQFLPKECVIVIPRHTQANDEEGENHLPYLCVRSPHNQQQHQVVSTSDDNNDDNKNSKNWIKIPESAASMAVNVQQQQQNKPKLTTSSGTPTNASHDCNDDINDDDSFGRDIRANAILHHFQDNNNNKTNKKRTRAEYTARTLAQVEQDTCQWHADRQQKRRHVFLPPNTTNNYRPFSLLYNECTLTALLQWSARPTHWNHPSQQQQQRQEDIKRMYHGFYHCRSTHCIVDPRLRKCRQCQLWGHYENECDDWSEQDEQEVVVEVGTANNNNKDEEQHPETSILMERCHDFLIEQRETRQALQYTAGDSHEHFLLEGAATVVDGFVIFDMPDDDTTTDADR